jgi:hypothetical protein
MEDSIDEIYSGSSLKASDLKGKTVKLTIEGVKSVRFDDGGVKVVCSFSETEKTLICNKTNAKRIAESHGKNPNRWIGKVIKIHSERVEYKGDIVDGIRVNLPEGATSDYDDEEAVSL